MIKGFIAGLLVGLLTLAGHALYLRQQAAGDPCLGRCGDGTSCSEGQCAVAPEPAAAKKKKKRGRRRRARRKAVDGTLRKPSAAQLRRTSGGQALGKVDYVDLSGEMGGGKGELSEAQVTAKVRRLDPEIIGCIQKASRGYDLGGRRVKVQVGFRIERSGRVKKVRIKAPRLLHQQGLMGCVRPLLRALVFPESGRALIMKYPYALD